jgi:hypothetical protein
MTQSGYQRHECSAMMLPEIVVERFAARALE